jgi:hypothetical protein
VEVGKILKLVNKNQDLIDNEIKSVFKELTDEDHSKKRFNINVVINIYFTVIKWPNIYRRRLC